MKKVCILFLTLCMSVCVAQAIPQNAQIIEINKDMQVRKLSEVVYLYTAWADVGSWGRVGSNGLIVVNDGMALLIDTPMHEKQTIELLDWLKTTLGANVVNFVPGHWHDDCVGGLDYLNKQGVKSYASRRTNEILKDQKKPQAGSCFDDYKEFNLGGITIECHYLGGGHATDNIVVWIPSQELLFGGCMLKDCTSDNLGNTADAAPLSEWLNTICKIEAKFPQAQLIIPGHGPIGGHEILQHTKEMLTKKIMQDERE